MRHSWRKWSSIGLFFLLTLAVWQSGSSSFRFEPLAGNAGVHVPLGERDRWKITGEPENVEFSEQGITLSQQKPGLFRVFASLPVPVVKNPDNKKEFVLVSADIHRSTELPLYGSDARRPAFVLRTATAEGDRRKGSVMRAVGSDVLQPVQTIVPLLEDAQAIELVWQVHQKGTWQLRDVEITLVSHTSYYYWSLGLLLALIATLFFIWAIKMVRMLTLLQGGVLFVLIPGVIGLTTLGRTDLDQLFEIVQRWMSPELISAMQLGSVETQKIGHVIVFFLITFTLLWVHRLLRLSLLQTCSVVLCLGFMTEALQRHSLTRTSSLDDVAIDAVGIALAALLWCFFCLLARLIKREPENTVSTSPQAVD